MLVSFAAFSSLGPSSAAAQASAAGMAPPGGELSPQIALSANQPVYHESYIASSRYKPGKYPDSFASSPTLLPFHPVPSTSSLSPFLPFNPPPPYPMQLTYIDRNLYLQSLQLQ